MDQEQNPAISKILEYAKDKSIITWDEISVLVGQDFVNSPEMERRYKYYTSIKFKL